MFYVSASPRLYMLCMVDLRDFVTVSRDQDTN